MPNCVMFSEGKEIAAKPSITIVVVSLPGCRETDMDLVESQVRDRGLAFPNEKLRRSSSSVHSLPGPNVLYFSGHGGR